MGQTTLNWNYDGLSGDGFRIYRSDSPMSVEALPAPLATVSISDRQYIDTTVILDQTYYYRVSSFSTENEMISEEIQHVAEIGVDVHFANVISLLHFDDIDGAITFTDTIGTASWTRVGSAVISTTDSKFGGSSLYLPPGSRIRSNTGLSIGTKAMTWDSWVYLNQFYQTYSIPFNIGNADNSSSGRECQLQLLNDGSISIYGAAVNNAAGQGGTGSSQRTQPGIISVGVWHYIEFSVTPVSAGKSIFRIFVDGIKVLESDMARGSFTANGISIGRGYYTATWTMDGYVDEWRLTIDVVRNTDNYTVPTFPPSDFGP